MSALTHAVRRARSIHALLASLALLAAASPATGATLDLEFVVGYAAAGASREHRFRRTVTVVNPEDNDAIAEFCIPELTPDRLLCSMVASATGLAASKIVIKHRRVIERLPNGCTAQYELNLLTVTTPDGTTEHYGIDLVEPPSPELGRRYWVLVDVKVGGQDAGGLIWRTFDRKGDALTAKSRVESGKDRRLAVYFRREAGAAPGTPVAFSGKVEEQRHEGVRMRRTLRWKRR